MEELLLYLPVVIYILLVVLLIICIILGIRFIITMKKVEELIDEVNVKIQSLNSLFGIMDFITDKISTISDSLLEFITSKIKLLFQKKKKEESEEYE